ncbi:hypothetical protein ACWPKO_17065 [Coraliomargarita sp. W4R53]
MKYILISSLLYVSSLTMTYGDTFDYTWNLNGDYGATAVDVVSGVVVSDLALTNPSLGTGSVAFADRFGGDDTPLDVLRLNREASSTAFGFANTNSAADDVFLSFTVTNNTLDDLSVDTFSISVAASGGAAVGGVVLATRLFDSDFSTALLLVPDVGADGGMNNGNSPQTVVGTFAPAYTVVAGQSKTFYIDFNSSKLSSWHDINFLSLSGTANAIPEAKSSALLFGLMGLGFASSRRIRS